MVELRGVEPSFPLYGAVRLRDGQTYSHRLLDWTVARWCGPSC